MIASKPHCIFAFFSLIVGFILVFLMPPISGIDESQHVRRVADIGNLKLLNPENDTDDVLAIWAENAFVLQVEAISKSPRWNFPQMLEDIKNLPPTLPEDRQVKLDKNPYVGSSPLMYLPFAVVFNIGEYFSLKPWEQFYILRLTNLFCSVFLIAIAIARMPEHKILLSALCLLPTMMNARSGVNIDGMVIGCAFLFIGQIYIMLRKDGIFVFKDIFLLFLFALLLAQCKGAYLPLLLLPLLLPAQKFISQKQRFLSLFMVIVPAMVTSLWWSHLVKTTILSGIRYINDNGEVWPDGQFAWLISHPIDYLMVVLRTIFASPMLSRVLVEFIGSIGWGHNSIVMKPIIVILPILLVMIIASEPTKKIIERSRLKLSFIGIIICAVIGMALTMLYVQWSAYQSPIIDGFQGRYLYPLLPLLVIFLPTPEKANNRHSILFLWIFAFVSVISTLWATVDFYYL